MWEYRDPRISLMIVLLLVVLPGCSDPRAEGRAKICVVAGVTEDAVKACRRSPEEFNRIMAPLRARQEREEIVRFNAALHALPSRTIPKDQYETTNLKKLNKEHSDLEFIEESKMPTHLLFGRRFRVQGEVDYHPTESENQFSERVALESLDSTDKNNTWSINADLESLDRSERAFVKNECRFLFDPCRGEFFGVIGPIQRGELQSLGLQIEYMKLSPRETKKPS